MLFRQSQNQATLKGAIADAHHAALNLDLDRVWKLASEGHPYLSPPRAAHNPLRFSKYMLKILLSALPAPPPSELVVVADTQNNLRALQPILSHLKAHDIVVYGWGNCRDGAQNTPWVDKQNRNALRHSIWKDRPQGSAVSDRIRDSACFLADAFYALRCTNAKSLLVTNDHSAFPGHAIQAARLNRTPSFYVQHAPVNASMPPLQVTAACLDGWESFYTYRSISNAYSSYRPWVFLTGKLDTPKPSQGDATGIAINMFDTPEEVASFLDAENIRNTRLIVRPHPRMGVALLKTWREFASEREALWSAPQEEDPEAFVSQLRTLYAGTSGIFLQAAMAGVACKQWGESPNVISDGLGFRRSGLVAGNDSPPATAPPSVLRRWSETWGTPWQGQEGRLVSDLITQRIRNGSFDPTLLGFQSHSLENGWVVWALPNTEYMPT